MTLMKTIATRIKQAREWAGLTQNELADHLGVTRPLVTAIENGRTQLTIEHLEALPAILDQPLGWFLGIEYHDLTDKNLNCSLYFGVLGQMSA